MTNLPFRTKLFIGFFFLIIGFYAIINRQLAIVSFLMKGLIGMIVILVVASSEIFDIIEKGSNSKYSDLNILPDNYSFINSIYYYIYIY